MATYVYRDGVMVDKRTGERMVDPDAPLACPRVMSDYEGYRSPVTGEWVEGRRARRYDIEKNGCIDGRDFAKPRKLKNRRFIEKRGLQHLSER